MQPGRDRDPRNPTLPSAGADCRPRCGNRRRDVGGAAADRSRRCGLNGCRRRPPRDQARLSDASRDVRRDRPRDVLARPRVPAAIRWPFSAPNPPALNPFQSTPPATPPATSPPWTIDATDTGVTLNYREAARDGRRRRHRHVCRSAADDRSSPKRRRPTPRVRDRAGRADPSRAADSGRRDPDESLYGLGQRQEGKLDIKGYDFDLWQRNTVVYVPMIVSSRGYGLLWDNTSPSQVRRPRGRSSRSRAATGRHVGKRAA